LLITLTNVQLVFTSVPDWISPAQQQQIQSQIVDAFTKNAHQQISIPDEIVSYIGVKTLMNGDFAVFVANPF
jgi:hypothetical protein